MKKNKILIIFFVLILILAGIAFYGYSNFVGDSKNKQIEIKVEENQSFDQVLDILVKEKIIKSKGLAKLWLKLHPQALIPGKHLVNSSLSLAENLNSLATEAIKEHVVITFIEGEWSKAYAKKIANRFNFTEEEILNKWNDPSYIQELAKSYPFLNSIKIDEQKRVLLEGYLFPDTYFFEVDDDLDAITRLILDQTQQVFESLKINDLSDEKISDVVTLASMIQYESGTVEDMGLVSSVFHNRLKINQKLESSVTVCYALYDYSHWTDCEYNIDIDSPYNTYLHQGLPIGPINNPGREALAASINPTESEYYYFISAVNHDSKMYFSKTFQEHDALVQKYLR